MNVLVLADAVALQEELRFKQAISWKLPEGTHWAIVGKNGAGKSLFCDYLTGKVALKQGKRVRGGKEVGTLIRQVSFSGIYDRGQSKITYYQQRWHSTENEEVPTVQEVLQGNEQPTYLALCHDLFPVEVFASTAINSLSSGELRKLAILRALLQEPQVLIIDQPYIGLDAPSRIQVNELFTVLAQRGICQLVLVLTSLDELPPVVEYILPIADKCLGTPYPARERSSLPQTVEAPINLPKKLLQEVLRSYPQPADYTYSVRLQELDMVYGKRTILHKLNWEVKKGERWAVVGANGSGKSTLLSVVCADNPQSYANNLFLFDKKRGSGESIWDIKRRIGYLSPEVHLYYHEQATALQVVGSGFFDSIGLHRVCTPEQVTQAGEWMRIFGIENLADRCLSTLSYGEQTLVLLARALVKLPEMLVLDEPLHGLDPQRKQLVLSVIEAYLQHTGCTLLYVSHYPSEIPSLVKHYLQLEKNS